MVLAKDNRTSAVSSVDPSSITINSKSWNVCDTTLAIALPIVEARLNVGMITLTDGEGLAIISWATGLLSSILHFISTKSNLGLDPKSRRLEKAIQCLGCVSLNTSD